MVTITNLPILSPCALNLSLSHAERFRVIAGEHRKGIASKNGIVPATFLVDGFVRGIWKTQRSRGRAMLLIEPFKSLEQRDRGALEEGERLVRFMAIPEKLETFEVWFAEP